MKRTIAIVAFLFAISPSIAQDRTWREELETGEAIWSKQKIHNYKITVKVSCLFCPEGLPRTGLIRATIAGGKLVGIDNASANEASLQDYSTVPGLFNLIRWWTRSNPTTIKLTFDKAYGFPRSILIDPDTRSTDDEIIAEVQSFEVVQ